MIFLQYDKNINGETPIMLIHYKPELLPNDILDTGTLVNEIPNEPIEDRKNASLFINTETQEVYYKLTDRPLTKEELLEDQIKDLQIALAELMGV